MSTHNKTPIVAAPPVGFRFSVTIDGGPGLPDLRKAELLFSSVSGLGAAIGTEALIEGGENRLVHQLPTRVQQGKLTLKRGFVRGSGLLAWFEATVEDSRVSPATVTVTLLDEAGQPIETWSFERAWPLQWSLGGFDAAQNAFVADTLELAYRQMKRVQGASVGAEA